MRNVHVLAIIHGNGLGDTLCGIAIGRSLSSLSLLSILSAGILTVAEQELNIG